MRDRECRGLDRKQGDNKQREAKRIHTPFHRSFHHQARGQNFGQHRWEDTSTVGAGCEQDAVGREEATGV